MCHASSRACVVFHVFVSCLIQMQGREPRVYVRVFLAHTVPVACTFLALGVLVLCEAHMQQLLVTVPLSIKGVVLQSV
jgi:hypothetical protein